MELIIKFELKEELTIKDFSKLINSIKGKASLKDFQVIEPKLKNFDTCRYPQSEVRNGWDDYANRKFGSVFRNFKSNRCNRNLQK